MIPDLEILTKHYIDENLSIREICAIYNISFQPVQKRLKVAGIKKDSLSIRSKINERIKQTSQIKYGTDHHMKSVSGYVRYQKALQQNHGVTDIMQLQRAKDSRAATCIRKYGVDHSLKAKSVRSKSKLTCIKRYGVDNPFKSKKLMASAVANRKTTNGYFGGGEIIPTRWGDIFVRSSYEAGLLKLLKQDKRCETVQYEHINLVEINYTPDFLINNNIIIEVKPKRFIYPSQKDEHNLFVQKIATKNRNKHKYIIKWARIHGFRYYLITEEFLNARYISSIIAKNL
jgi:hypothetical protein